LSRIAEYSSSSFGSSRLAYLPSCLLPLLAQFVERVGLFRQHEGDGQQDQQSAKYPEQDELCVRPEGGEHHPHEVVEKIHLGGLLRP